MKIDHSYGIIPVCFKNEQILFLLVEHKNGHWGFPKGHTDQNEKPLETALRELQEETNISTVEIIPQTTFTDHYQYETQNISRPKTVTYYIGLVPDSQQAKASQEIKSVRWLPSDEALDTLTYKSAKNLLQSVNEFLTENSHNTR